MNEKLKHNYLDWMVEDVANKIYLNGNTTVTYKGFEFQFQQIEHCSPFDMSCMTVIHLKLPYYLQDKITERIGVTYDSHAELPRHGSRTVAIERGTACHRLARDFVFKTLPKVDFELMKETSNMELEEILEVLE